MIRSREQLIRSIGMSPSTLAGESDSSVCRRVANQALLRITQDATVLTSFHATGAQQESAVNALVDCMERLDDLSKGNDD